VHFLDGILEERAAFGCRAIWWPTRGMHIEAEYGYLHYWDIPLEGGDRGTVEGHRLRFITGYHLF
jgi:hypothetical protein